MAKKKDIEYFLAQARRIAAHREAGAEKEIRKLYKSMLKELNTFISETYVQYAEDDKLTYAMLQKAGYDARFLEEVEQRLNLATPKAAQELRSLVEETYEVAWKGMMDGVAAQGVEGLETAFADSIAITPEQIKVAVENPVSGLTLKDTLENNRREIIYNIKRTVGLGLMNGDRYTTMARRISEQVDGDYKKAIRIARTETHRVVEAGNAAAAESVDKELQGGTTSMRMTKTWKTMKDERVRPQRKSGKKRKMGKGANHIILDGQTVLADELFDLKDGNTAKAPGSSGVAGHDINCRCYVSYNLMTDAEYFAATGKHFPGFKGLENAENSDIIEPEVCKRCEMMVNALERNGVEYRAALKHTSPLSENEIISALAGGDLTQGSCASVGLAYIGQKGGLNVRDFRGEMSQRFFSLTYNLVHISEMPGVKTIKEVAKTAVTAGNRLLKHVVEGKEYYFVSGRHAAIVRKAEGGVLQYLELQSEYQSGWHNFDGNPRYTLKNRFGDYRNSGLDVTSFMIEVDSIKDSPDLRKLLGYINTAEDQQRKGKYGTIK